MSENISDMMKFQLQQVWSHIVGVQTDDCHLLKNSCWNVFIHVGKELES